MSSVLLSPDEAAELADVKPAQLKLWLQTGQFKTDTWSISLPECLNERSYAFTEADVSRLIAFAATQGKHKPSKKDPFVDDGRQENFSVAEVASLWHLSPDTIQRIFEDEPGVLPLGEKNPRGKRRRITLRIPRAVMQRVRKRRSNA